MSFEVDRYSSAWAQIALCADLTWATEPPDEFIIANQRLWTQHCRVSQVLQETTSDSQSLQTNNQVELTDNTRTITNQNQENGNNGRRNVKEVIPESRLAQFYGNFYYDEAREKCYTNTNERTNLRGYNSQGCENSDLTECWMLPEVEYWFRKLLDESSERSMFPRRRRQYRMLPDEDLDKVAKLATQRALVVDVDVIASERWGPSSGKAADEEAALAARVLSVRALWASPIQQRSSAAHTSRTPSPPTASRKMRARRRQPRRLTALAPPPPAYCLDVPAQLFCDPTCKFQFDPPKPPQLTDCQRAMGRLTANVQAVMRASAARCLPYRGTNVSRYAPTGQRPMRCPDRRYGIWWPRDHPSPRLDNKFQLTHIGQTPAITSQKSLTRTEPEKGKKENSLSDKEASSTTKEEIEVPQVLESQSTELEKPESPISQDQVIVDAQLPSTSAAAMETGLRKKRLYSTVLSMSAPAPIGLNPVIRLAQKLVTPGLLKLNTKMVLPGTRVGRPPNVDHKFEELEKEALEQYKPSDESIDTKFQELEKQAVEQYSTSNSNTSCSSGNSADKRTSGSPSESDTISKQPAIFHKEKPVDSVVIYSQNFPDLNSKGQASSVMNLKNCHTPPRGEKKEQTHRSSKTLRSLKNNSHRPASDTDYDARDTGLKGNHKGPMRWTLHVVPPKKRHLTLCVSDFSSDDDIEDGSMKDAGPYIKNHVVGKMKMSAHGGGDLHPIMRKT